jgi:hypothetical protein
MIKLGMNVFTFLILFATAGICQEQCLLDAWVALDVKKFDSAITHADKCINEFGKIALKMQKRLVENGIPAPPTGKVSDEEKNAIFARGILNDVSAAYLVKGEAAEKLYNKEKEKNSRYKAIANEAYKKAIELEYGRVWDPKGWFWSPSEAADLRIPVE